jgi:hypothetical protein
VVTVETDWVRGELIKDARFVDDQGMVASTGHGLQKVMDASKETPKTYDIKTNVRKTKAITASREEGRMVNITIDGQAVEHILR